MNLFQRNLNVRVNNFKLPSIQMSTVLGLSDLFEEEIIAIPIPINIDLENVKINIIEDRPPMNITSPGAQPISLCIGKMNIQRDLSGVFQIQPIQVFTQFEENENENTCEGFLLHRKDREREILSMHLIMKQLKIDNEQLRTQLIIAERNIESSRQKIRHENDILKTYLKAAQDDVSTLLDEKRTLMDTIKSLQVRNYIKN